MRPTTRRISLLPAIGCLGANHIAACGKARETVMAIAVGAGQDVARVIRAVVVVIDVDVPEWGGRFAGIPRSIAVAVVEEGPGDGALLDGRRTLNDAKIDVRGALPGSDGEDLRSSGSGMISQESPLSVLWYRLRPVDM